MFCLRRVRHVPSRPLSRSRELRRSIFSDADVEQARKYCVNQLRGDYESYLVRQFVPSPARDAYDALRTLNLELARLPETVSNATIGHLRVQFWRDAVNNTFAGKPPREPVSILLSKAVSDLAARSSRGDSQGSASMVKFWLLRFISTREGCMDNRPFPTLDSLEEYAENTYSTLMYMTLAATPLRSVHLDHLASHIGKAYGIAAVLRGVPVLAAPSPPVRTPTGAQSAPVRNPAVLLPLDAMAAAGLREEDVIRRGPDAPGLRDAVFAVATRAHHHLLTARDMLRDLRAGRPPGHAYEHAGETDHLFSNMPPTASHDSTAADLRHGFGVLLEAVPAGAFLTRLEQADFDPFSVGTGWKLPWSIWRALKRQEI